MTLILFSTILILISVLRLIHRKRNRRRNELISKIPSPPYGVWYYIYLIIKYWIKTRDSSKAYFDMFHDLASKFEKDGIFHVNLYPFTDPVIIITAPKAYKDILEDKDNLDKNVSYEFLVGLIGRRNLIMSGAGVWKHDRKIVNQSFKYSNLNNMNQIIDRRSNMMINMINVNQNVINDLHPLLASTITHIILEAAVGKRINAGDRCLKEYVDGQILYANSMVIQAAFPIFFVFPALFYNTIGIRVKYAIRRIRAFIAKAVDERIDKVIKSKLSREELQDACLSDSLIEAYLSDAEAMPKDVIVDHVVTFIFVGHKATSYTLNAILFLLASHPEKQKKLQGELDASFGPLSADDLVKNPDILNVDKLNKLTYLTAVIKEGQRMYPISASIGRKITKEFNCNGCTIPEKSEILFDFNSLTKHPDAFHYKPKDFIPERFIPDAEGWDTKRTPFSFLPFSHGLRKCIGEKFAMNMLRMILVKILFRYNLSTTLTMDDISMVQDIMAYIRTPIDIKFTERLTGENEKKNNYLKNVGNEKGLFASIPIETRIEG